MVVLLVDQVNRAARLVRACVKNRAVHSVAVHALATKVGEERGVDVERAARPGADPESSQVPAEQHEVDLVGTEEVIESVARILSRRAINHRDRHAERLTPRYRTDVASVRDHYCDRRSQLPRSVQFHQIRRR